MPKRYRFFAFALAAVCLLPTATTAAEKPPAAQPPLTIDSIAVTPPNPAVDTLCHLAVTLHNAGDKTISQLAFRVAINGQDLPVYDNQIFMQPLPPGKVTTVKLYNFWSTETSRPAPKDGKLEVTVKLAAAQWYSIGMKKDKEGDVEEWNPLGAVDGLPQAKSLSLKLAAKKPGR